MTVAFLIALALSTCGQKPITAAAPIDPKPVPKEIRLPDLVAPTPKPSPLPADSIPVLPADKYYVVDSDVELFVRASPPGLLSIESHAGPLTFPTRSLIEGGATKFKTYSGKSIYIVEAVGTGRVELLLIPKGVQEDSAILQRTIDANNGPKPPPGPPPTPTPPELPELARKARDWAATVNSTNRPVEAKAIAGNFWTASTKQAAGGYFDLAAMSEALRVANRDAVPDATESAWRTMFFAPLQQELTKRVKTLADYGAACREIAQGLEAVR